MQFSSSTMWTWQDEVNELNVLVLAEEIGPSGLYYFMSTTPFKKRWLIDDEDIDPLWPEWVKKIAEPRAVSHAWRKACRDDERLFKLHRDETHLRCDVLDEMAACREAQQQYEELFPPTEALPLTSLTSFHTGQYVGEM